MRNNLDETKQKQKLSSAFHFIYLNFDIYLQNSEYYFNISIE